MSLINCLKCKQSIDAQYDQCPHCSEKVTNFQRTYSTRLLDGKYQIIDRLGVGGMGEIFKVRHIHLNELRVIKIMRPNVAADDQGLQRFLQEARTSTMIKHKNLAMLYDFAQLDDGSYYMVWEFIDGTNIQRWIGQTGALPPRLAIEIAVQALNGLDHLHSMGLIHRDISPENIMLSQDHHGKLLVKVIDFGIAKQLGESEQSGQGLTQTGMFLGKLKYASPEQAGFLKDGEHLDPRSDLYSFGILMYEMLAGRAPFQATNPHGYILKHVTEKPQPIIELNPASHVPPQLEAIIMRSLEKNREQRFATAADFAEALEGIRQSIAPDSKYGLGERMVTLSGAQTLADLKMTATNPQMTAGGAQQTQQTFAGATIPGNTTPGMRLGPTGTRAASDEATVMERNLANPTRSGSDDATVMERFGSPGAAAPTAIEAKMQFGNAQGESTVIERQYQPAAPKRNVGMIAAIAAIVVILIGAGVYFATRKPTDPIATATSIPSGTDVTSTGPAPLAPNEGLLLLSASPWGDIDKIVSTKDNKEIPVADNLSTPARLELAPGNYDITLLDQSGRPTTVAVTVESGKPTRKKVDMGTVNYDELYREVTRP
ncbi:MAG TPA: serine/threonine-protein kinase [Thermoanaerobaculia bacterium]|jgi:serine/threonine-protein kinase|nr:serine/threonine-protein kinase [Thermoanaerobaculia bacterium]